MAVVELERSDSLVGARFGLIPRPVTVAIVANGGRHFPNRKASYIAERPPIVVVR